MNRKLLENRPGSSLAIVAVLALFVGIGFWYYGDMEGQDLASSFVGSRLLAQGQAQHLFSYDSQDFSEIGDDDTWIDVAQLGGFNGFLHPYVQTPLWAYMLQPLATRVNFLAFNYIFTFLTMLSFAGTIWLAARYWAPSFFNPVAIVLVLVLLAGSQPFQYAMFLNQTHMLLVFLTVAALVLAERNWPVAAGLLLAYAAAIKITPGLLVVYWLMTRRWKAAGSAVVWSGVLWLLTTAAVGHSLMQAYSENLQRISRVLLVSQNNQSFAAWLMARFYSPDEVWDITIYRLPTILRLSSSVLMLGFTALGGWLDWRRRQQQVASAGTPLGAMIAIVAATIFAPIAWTHYAVLLFVPLMLLTQVNRDLRLWWVWVLLAAALAMNYPPLATDIVNGLIGTLSIVRGQFYSCALTLAALTAVALKQIYGATPKAHMVQRSGAVVA